MNVETNEAPKARKANMTSVIFNDVANDTQICYHLLHPKNLNLIKRPKRTLSKSGETAANKRRRRGRPRKEDAKKVEEPRRNDENAIEAKTDELSLKIPCQKTRSGRVSRPPKHMSKFVDIKAPVNSTDVIQALPEQPINDLATLNMVADDVIQATQTTDGKPLETKRVRKNVAKFTCGVCKKVNLK